MSGSPIWHPFTQHGLGEPIPLVERAEGAFLYGPNGERWIDAISSWWVTTHGHCHPRIMAAIAEQAQKLDQLIFAGWTHEAAEALARSLVELIPAALPRVFFSDSGSTAVEVALKMALGTWENRGEQRHRIVVMEHSYHGDTIGAMSVGQRGVFNRAYAPLLFDVTRVPFPHAGQEQATYDALQSACSADAAAFIVEPLLLGAGGMLVYSPHVLKEMHRICAAHGVLFIADEVLTGWGRTGTLTACEQAGVDPDLMCLSKGLTGGALPLAVTLASEAIYAAHCSPDRGKMFFHSSSYTANPIACAAANANLAIWREEPVQQRLDTLSARQAERLIALQHVENKRQCGTVTACDLPGGTGYLASAAPRLMAIAREAGVLLRPLGNTVYVMPPYSIDEPSLDAVYAVISAASP